jgi:precorrin-4/cobalt-precorrin-4 C11-methyltransferase
LHRLRKLDIPFTITPGVPAFAASAAALGQELSVPGLAQSLVLTRTSGRASPLPERETLEHFAASGTTLAIHLSVHVLASVVERLLPFYGPDCGIAVVYRASWPDERVIRGQLNDIVALVGEHSINATATILVGPSLTAEGGRESALYSRDYQRRFRGRP